jgi:transcription initiation factor TFIIIB Brf1 subunit/transcription initiation factor TFIIB
VKSRQHILASAFASSELPPVAQHARQSLSCQQALESGGVKGRQAMAMHAACVYMACRLEHNPRTFKEILAGAPGTSKVRKARLGKGKEPGWLNMRSS